MTVSDQENFESHFETLQLPLYVAGMLDQSERKELEQHLTQCPTCQKELEIEKRLQPAIQKALETRPNPSARVLQRAKEKIAQTSQQQEREQRSAQDVSHGWMARLEQWILQLFKPRWVPAFALLVILIQGSVLQFLLTSPSTTRPPGMEGPIFERELSPPSGSTTQTHRVQILFSPDLPLKTLQSLLEQVHGTIIQGPNASGKFIIELPYDSHEQLQDSMNTLKAAKAVENVELWHP